LLETIESPECTPIERAEDLLLIELPGEPVVGCLRTRVHYVEIDYSSAEDFISRPRRCL
jgi:hypothetical protein